jgi:hypothetical protein
VHMPMAGTYSDSGVVEIVFIHPDSTETVKNFLILLLSDLIVFYLSIK